MIPDEAQELLLSAGVVPVAGRPWGGRHGVDVILRIPGEAEDSENVVAVEVKRFSRTVSARELLALVSRRRAAEGRLTATDRHPGLLLIVPSASVQMLNTAARHGVSVIALNRQRATGPSGHLAIGPRRVLSLTSSGDERPDVSANRPPSAVWRVIRILLLFDAVSQTQLAQWAGVSQPRVSQVLKRLVDQGHVRATRRRPSEGAQADGGRPGPSRPVWSAADWQELLQFWIEAYPGPGGVTTYWTGLEDLATQVRSALALLAARPGSAEVEPPASLLVSGDVAADYIAPWARPAEAVIYAHRGADLAAAGLVPCAARDATLALVVPEDEGVWALVPSVWEAAGKDPTPGGLPLADPVQVLYDVHRSRAADRQQIADRLLRWLSDARPGIVREGRSLTISPFSSSDSRGQARIRALAAAVVADPRR